MEKRVIDDITKFVFVKDEIEKADIIFIPGANYPELGECAADLYKRGYADKIMPSGGVSIKGGRFGGVRGGVKSKKEIYCKDYSTDYEFLSDVLQINGVSADAIIEESTSGWTKENAYFSRKVADDKSLDIKKAILCCRNFHARRALMFYQFAFPEVKFFVHPVTTYDNDVEITPDNWYTIEIGVKRVLGEIQRYSNQFNEEFLSIVNVGL